MKALIISHNPMSTKHSIGKTLLSLFSDFKKEEMCQLYIHTGVPEFDVCSSFYRIADKDVLYGVFKRKVAGGQVAASADGRPQTNSTDSFYKQTYGNPKNRAPHRELLRDMMWKMSPWYNKDLKNWIGAEKPTCIFVAIGSGKFLYDMALKISKDYNIPIYTYVCDDFYSMKTPRGICGGIWKKSLVKKTRKLMERSRAVISICEEMSDLYGAEFGRPAVTVMTGTNYSVAEIPKVNEGAKTIRYFGKVSLNRYKSIADICRAIDKLNEKLGENFSLEIYCDDIGDEVKTEFRDIKSARFCGYISGEEFKDRFFSSDILLHIEAFDAESVDRVRHSVSTKIADSMASGIPMFAYGPDSVASIRHLLRNNAGVVATSKDELEEKIKSVFLSREVRLEAARNGIETAKKYHDSQKASAKIFELLNDSEL